MNLDELNAEIKKLEEQNAQLHEKMEPINNELMSNAGKLRELRDKRDTILSQNNEDNWEWLLFEDGRGSSTKNKLLEQKLMAIGLYVSGYYHDTQQRAIKLMLIKNDPQSFTRHLAAIELLLPYLKTHPDGFTRFSIFEHTLSRYGSFALAIGEKIILEVNRRAIQEFNTIEDALKYIQEHHWYEKKSKRK